MFKVRREAAALGGGCAAQGCTARPAGEGRAARAGHHVRLGPAAQHIHIGVSLTTKGDASAASGLAVTRIPTAKYGYVS
jgi:hypothetical protein